MMQLKIELHLTFYFASHDTMLMASENLTKVTKLDVLDCNEYVRRYGQF